MRRHLIASIVTAAVCAIPVWAIPVGAGAHHSFAMYDQSKVVTLKGAVKMFHWTNPHVVMQLTGSPNGAGAPDTWTVELTSPGNLTRLGWSRNTVAVGDKVTIEINQLRSGERGGGFRRITLADGRVLGASLIDLEKGGPPK